MWLELVGVKDGETVGEEIGGRVYLDRFLAVCESRKILPGKIGLQKTIFTYFAPMGQGTTVNFLSREDFLSLDVDKLSVRKKKTKRASVGFKSTTGISEERRRQAARQRKQQEEQWDLKKKQDVGPSDLAEFMAELTRKYGNIPRAWRFLFDLDESGKISRTEFITAARDGSNYRGDILGLFGLMDEDGSGIITLNELDPVAFQELGDFRRAVDEVYQEDFFNFIPGGRKSMWMEMAEVRGATAAEKFEAAETGRVSLERFLAVCEEKQILAGKAAREKIFSYLVAVAGTTQLVYTDFMAFAKVSKK